MKNLRTPGVTDPQFPWAKFIKVKINQGLNGLLSNEVLEECRIVFGASQVIVGELLDWDYRALVS